MNKITLKEQENLFKEECKIINLQYEYRGYTGNEKFAIISELSEKELFDKYPDIISGYTPFILLSVSHGEVINEYRRNDDKFKKREVRSYDAFGYDEGLTEHFHRELIESYESPLEMLEREETGYIEEQLRQLKIMKVQKTLSLMKPLQRERLLKSVARGLSSREIAKEEGVNYSAVDKSIKAAKKNFKRIYENL